MPANLRNYLMLLDVMEGKGPIYMRTEEAIAKLAEKYADDPKAYKKGSSRKCRGETIEAAID